jgi:hypothetical protein
VNEQLVLDLDFGVDELADLDCTRAEAERAVWLAELEAAPRPAACRCWPRGVPVDDGFGEAVCWLCGRRTEAA